MKKANLVLIVCLLMSLVSVQVSAAAVTASMTGPSVIRAGDILTVAVQINGTGLFVVKGELQYDAAQLSSPNVSGELSGWEINVDSQTGKLAFLAEDKKLNAPINSRKQLFKVSFKVNNSIAVGSLIKITLAKMEASDGNTDFSPANAAFSVNVAAPLSNNANLSSLSVSSGTLTPAFSKATTNYSLSVPYKTDNIQITAQAEDAAAKVSVNSPKLVAGSKTAVTVTVTAESGDKKTYTISVTRAPDPNYVPSSNNNLKEIQVTNALLSPIFRVDHQEYVVYVPFEVEKLDVNATPEDSRASVDIDGSDKFEVGHNNRINIICTAENGDKRAYVIAVVRAEAFVDLDQLDAKPTSSPEPTPTATPQATTSTTQANTTQTTKPVETTQTEPTGSNQAGQQQNPGTGIIVLILILAVLVVAELGFIIYLGNKLKNRG